MIYTQNFKTKTIFTERKNESVDGIWTVALDIGYSAVKGFSNNMIYSFPSYCRKMTNQMLAFGETNKTDILYKDNETGETWVVGSAAQDMITSDETRDSIAELYGRNRYFSEIFKVISRVGMGIGMLTNQYDSPNGKKLVVQTGLPPAYLKSDTSLLKEALAGKHNFSIKIGNKQWVSLSYDLPEENIYVMPQPMGTLLSISTDNSGKTIPEASKYFKSSMLIFDPGFGTLDVFKIRNKMIESSETFDNLGMKRVLQETSDRIMDKFHQEVPVPAMQKLLTTGEVKCFDRKNRRTSLESFSDLLEESSKKVCYEALQKVDNIYNNLFDHDYLVITGGTGDAWKNIITEYYSGMESLKIINGNQNDMLPTIFSNVRGYYLYIVNKMKRQTGVQ
jgi:plasmid segregation protein ParM